MTSMARGALAALKFSGCWEVLLLALILASVTVIGRRLLSLFHLEPEPEALEAWLFSAGIGLGSLGGVTFLLGVAHLLYPVLVRVLLLALIAFSIGIRPRGRSSAMRLGLSKWPGSMLLVVAVFSAAVYLLAALAPETGFDALNYHLGLPRLYIHRHAIYPTPHIVYSNFPLLGEMLFTFGWLIDSMLLAKLFHLACGLLTVAAIAVVGRRYFCLDAGLLAAVLFMASPIVGFLMQTAYVDLTLTLYVLLTVYAALNWTCALTSRRGWLSLSGLMAGLAFSTKYTGILVLPIVAVIVASMLFSCPPSRRRVLGQSAQFLCVFALTALPWLVKNFTFTGNPIAPLLSNVIYNPDFTPEAYHTWIQTTSNWAGFTGGVWDYIRSPWLLTRYGNIFVGVPGPLFLALFPVALWVGIRQKSVRNLVLISAGLYLLQIVSTRLVRYQVPVLPFVSLAIAGAVFALLRPDPKTRGLRRGGSTLIIVATCVAVAQLPMFSRFWMNSQIQTVSPKKLQIFGSSNQRKRYLAHHLGGPEVLQLYSYLNSSGSDDESVLALTVGYQALSDSPIYMAPNSTPATKVSDDFWEASLRSAGLGTLQLVPDSAVWSRFWRVVLDEELLSERDDFYRPRFFFLEEGVPLEVNLFRAHRQVTKRQLTVCVDLGAERRVDRIQLWARTAPFSAATAIVEGISSSNDGREWADVPSTVKILYPRAHSIETLVDDMCGQRIRFLFFRELPEAPFLGEFFKAQGVRKEFELVGNFGEYRVYRVRDCGRVAESLHQEIEMGDVATSLWTPASVWSGRPR